MNRWDSDQDYSDDLNGPYETATCEDCRVEFIQDPAETTSRCAACWDRRDAHTSGLELKQMAKAICRRT